MSDLLDAARKALPGVKWVAIDHGYHARDPAVGIREVAGATKRPYQVLFEGRWQRKATLDDATKWLRAQVTARRDALDAALGDVPDPFDLPMPGPDCSANEHVAGCRHHKPECTHATKDDCAAAECEPGGIRDCIFGEPLHYHHDGCPAAYSADVPECDRAALNAAGWVPVGVRLPDLLRDVPLWTDRGLMFGSRGGEDGDGNDWLWGDQYGDQEAFADVVVTHWMDCQPPVSP